MFEWIAEHPVQFVINGLVITIIITLDAIIKSYERKKEP